MYHIYIICRYCNVLSSMSMLPCLINAHQNTSLTPYHLTWLSLSPFYKRVDGKTCIYFILHYRTHSYFSETYYIL